MVVAGPVALEPRPRKRTAAWERRYRRLEGVAVPGTTGVDAQPSTDTPPAPA